MNWRIILSLHIIENFMFIYICPTVQSNKLKCLYFHNAKYESSFRYKVYFCNAQLGSFPVILSYVWLLWCFNRWSSIQFQKSKFPWLKFPVSNLLRNLYTARGVNFVKDVWIELHSTSSSEDEGKQWLCLNHHWLHIGAN